MDAIYIFESLTEFWMNFHFMYMKMLSLIEKNNRIRTAWKQKNRTNITRIKAGNMKSNKKRIKRAWKKQKTKNELEEIETELERLETKIIKEGIKEELGEFEIRILKTKTENKIEALKQTEKITKK